MPKLASRVGGISSFEVMDILARAQALEREGRDVVHLEVGEPDFPTAAPILEAARELLKVGRVTYTAATGMPALKEAVARYYADRHGVDVDPGRIIITAGATGGLLLLAGLLLEPNQELLMADPGYPCNRNFVQMVGAAARNVPVTAADRYQLNASHLDAHWDERTGAALVASPANPTGAMITRADLAALVAGVVTRDSWLIVDEIYQGLTFGNESSEASADLPGTVLAVADPAQLEHVFVVNSFSKYFGMTGWRLGWIVAPEAAVAPLERLSQNFVIAPSTVAQHAAMAAFSPAAMAIHEERREAFRVRRDFLYQGLTQLGFGIDRVPEGAFYLYCRLNPDWAGRAGELARDARAFCRHHLETGGVALTPGTDFGAFRANEHIRIAYTCDVDRLAVALDRLAEGLRA